MVDPMESSVGETVQKGGGGGRSCEEVFTMPGSESIQMDFPHYSSVLLDTLNKQRLEGKFCDLSIQVQGRIFRAHKTVLAASSPYFHDKLLLNDTNCLVLPSVIQPDAFENLLQLIYSGSLSLEIEALPSHLLVASGLQMWQVVDRCCELLKERQACTPVWSSRASESQSPSSSFQPPREDKQPTIVTLNSDDEDVIKVRVSEEEEEEEEVDDDGKCISANCSYARPSSSSSIGSPNVIFLKQENGDEDSSFLKSFEMSDVKQEMDMEKSDYPSELSFVVPLPSPPTSSDVSLCLPNKLYVEPESPSFSISKPLDLHGNEIVAPALQAQTIHAPVKLVAAPDGKKFGCLCGKRFAVKPKRDRHIMLTFSLRPFGCSVCNKKFKLKHHLTEHMKTHGSNLYSCEDCGRKFRVETCYQKHKEACKGQRWAGACWTYN